MRIPLAEFVWTVIVPVKGTAAAKSRLGRGPEFALAMALDTVEAAQQAADVVVVTDLAAPFEALGVRVLTGAPTGLVPALEWAIAREDPTRGIAVLLGDLPALRPHELREALDNDHDRAIVADGDGTGTALAMARPGVPHRLRFGADSRASHVAAGYVELEGDWPGLRRDVDLTAHLAGLVTGPRTRLQLGGEG